MMPVVHLVFAEFLPAAAPNTPAAGLVSAHGDHPVR